MQITGLLIENSPDMVPAGRTVWTKLFWRDDHFNECVLNCAVNYGRITIHHEGAQHPALFKEDIMASPILIQPGSLPLAHQRRDSLDELVTQHLYGKPGYLTVGAHNLSLADVDDSNYRRGFHLALIHNDGKPLSEEVVESLVQTLAFIIGPLVTSDGSGLAAKLNTVIRILDSDIPYHSLKGDYAVVDPQTREGVYVPYERGEKSKLFDATCIVTGRVPDNGVVSLSNPDRVRCFIDSDYVIDKPYFLASLTCEEQ